MGKTIILAHGILGFGHLPLISVNYFNGIAYYLKQFNHRVLEPQVSPIGRVKTRGEELEAAIRREKYQRMKKYISSRIAWVDWMRGMPWQNFRNWLIR